MAEQLTHLDYDRFLDLDPYDLVYLTWAKNVTPENFICALAERYVLVFYCVFVLLLLIL